MKKIMLLTFLIASFMSIKAQKSYIFKSKDGKISAENFIASDEKRDSVVITNKKHKLKFSCHEPFIKIRDSEGYNLFDNAISIRNIKRIKKHIYLLVGYGGNLNVETELHLIFIKKNKVLKYYVLKSYDKRLRDVTCEYLSKTKEVIIPITKQYTPQNYIYEINLKENKLDTLMAMKQNLKNEFYRYKLKI